MPTPRGPLDDYRAKRDFGRTPEPAPGDAHAAQDGAPVFVVHRHDARNLHYDLRLEADGVLMSWAVPKGFSYAVGDKRLAVRTEDHPIEYLSFDGLIPAGEYGAGSMTIWDHGRVHYLQEGAPRSWVEAGELKLVLDGRRLRGEWHLVRTARAENHWLLFKSRDRYAGPARATVLGVDLTRAPRADLPARWRPMAPGGEAAPFSDPDWLFEVAFDGLRVGAEKRADALRWRGGAARALGRRADVVLDALRELRAEDALIDGVLVVQDEADRPSRELLDARLAGEVGAALLYYAFDLLHFDGFDLRPLPLRERKAALAAVLPAHGQLLFVDHVPTRGEELAATASVAGLGGLIAKRAGAPAAAGPSDDWLAIPVAAAPGARSDSAPLRERLAPSADPTARLAVTNPGKVYWPADGTTKAEHVGWYASVADLLLPYLRDRPVHMHRFPDGVEGKSFYQRHGNAHIPDWFHTEWIPGSEDPSTTKQHFVCDDRRSLLYLANLGAIDLHPWLSRLGSLESPDWCVIDLDPKQAPFAHVVRIARAVGKLLHGIGLRPGLKTSGKTGLHVYVPLVPGYGYEQVRMFAEMVARIVAREQREIATVERALDSRDGRVYVDFGQNRRGATVVPPYVVRPAAVPSVSTPLHWDELDGDLDPARFTIRSLPERLDRLGDLFAPTLSDRQELLGPLERLADAWGR